MKFSYRYWGISELIAREGHWGDLVLAKWQQDQEQVPTLITNTMRCRQNLGHTLNSMSLLGSIVKTPVPLNSVNWLGALFRTSFYSGFWAHWSQNPSTLANFGITRAKLWSTVNCRTPGMSRNSRATWLILGPMESKPYSHRDSGTKELKPWSCREL